ncbi:MAG TPA: MFS transporter, partial [Burkholderiales bacterium]|nr:MFS transporter [Burkholderiales bacterium]
MRSQRASLQTREGAILLAISGAAFLGPFTQTVYTPSLPELQHYFDVNTVLINLTISLFTAILAVSNFVVGPLADTRGRRAVLLPGLLLFALGSALCLVSTTYGWFLTGRALQACGISTALLVAPTVIGDVYAPDVRARAMSVYQTVSFLGPVFGPVVGGIIAAYLNWRWAFALLAIAALVAWQYNRARLPETLARNADQRRVTLRTFAGVLRNRSALAIVLIGFSQFYGYYAFLVFLPALLASLFALSAGVKGFFFVPLTAGILLGLHVGIRWQRAWSRTRILTASSYAIGVNVLLLWLALSMSLVTMPVLIAFLLVYGMLLGCSLPVQSTILVNLFTTDKGTAVGVYNCLRFTGAAIGPMLGGAIEMAFGVDAVFLNVSILLLAAAVLI